jgi:uncharacterized repeat protein (TIGR03806 family)
MRWKSLIIFSALSAAIALAACNKEEEFPTDEDSDPLPETGVSFDLSQVPYPKLSDYRFFIDTMVLMHPNEGVIPYDVITPLFSDYAKKKRFIWMPQGAGAQYVNDREIVDFPEGTVMIKSFYYDNVQPLGNRKMIETRLIYKKNGEWKFADYIWNDDQTEATFDLEGAYQNIEWVDDSGLSHTVNYRIPSEVECYTCHKFNDTATPIGPKPQNLNKSIVYDDGIKNQLQKWAEVGYLSSNYPSEIETVADWTDESQTLENRWRAYVDMNCSHCHREGSHCDYRPLRLAWSETTNPDNLGICISPEEFVAPQITHIIARSNVNRSMMHYRLNTTEEQYRMPLFGRTVIHQEAVTLLESYINSLTPTCP